MLNILGIETDTQFYQSLEEVSWNNIEFFSEQPNTLDPLVNLLAMKIGESYLKTIWEDKQVIQYHNEIAWENVISSVRGAIDSFFQPFRNTFNKEKAYNVLFNPDVTDEELEEYATNALAAGLTVYGLGKGVQAVKPKISVPKTVQPIVNANGTMQLAAASAPSISVAVEGGLLRSLAYSVVGNHGSSYKGSKAGKEGSGQSKSINDILHGAKDSTNNAGVVRNFVKSGRFEKH